MPQEVNEGEFSAVASLLLRARVRGFLTEARARDLMDRRDRCCLPQRETDLFLREPQPLHSKLLPASGRV
jgi:hypothetical protein